MTASVASFLTQAQKQGSELPPPLSGALLLAALRLSDRKQQALRPYQLLVDDEGELELLSGEPPTADGYAAPELRNGAALPHDPRVLVYAAGALGYELITMTPPRLSGEVGAELDGPFAPVIRKAMGERRERYRTLEEMANAIEGIQARPTPSEEKLILAAVASSTQLPAAQKLAKIELQRASAGPPPEPVPSAAADPPFGAVWDKMEPEVEPEPAPSPAPPAPRAAPPPPAPPPARAVPAPAPAAPPPPPAVPPPAASAAPEVLGALEELRAQVRGLAADRKRNQEDWMMLAGRIESLSGVRSRVDALEELVKSSIPAPAAPATALAREVKVLVDERRFAEAEQALQSPLAATDATLQLRLGQTLAATTDPDGSRAARAEAAFRRAGQLDPAWAQPKAHLGLLLLRKGKREEGLAHLRAALEQDPTCPEAQQAVAQAPSRASSPRGFDFRLVISTAVGAVAAAGVLIAVRPAAVPAPAPVAAAVPVPPAPVPSPPLQAAPPPAPPTMTAAVAPATRAVEAKPPPPARKPDPEPQAEKPARPEPRPRKRTVASAGSGNRSAAEAEAVKGDRALRAFDTRAAQSAFESALKLDPTLPGAHRGMGMVYVLLGKNAEARSEYATYLQLAPDAPDKDQIERLLAR